MAQPRSDSMSSMDKGSSQIHPVHLERSVSGRGENALAAVNVGDAELSATAARAREAEAGLGLWQAFKAYRWAVFWSILVSMVSDWSLLSLF